MGIAYHALQLRRHLFAADALAVEPPGLEAGVGHQQGVGAAQHADRRGKLGGFHDDVAVHAVLSQHIVHHAGIFAGKAGQVEPQVRVGEKFLQAKLLACQRVIDTHIAARGDGGDGLGEDIPLGLQGHEGGKVGLALFQLVLVVRRHLGRDHLHPGTDFTEFRHQSRQQGLTEYGRQQYLEAAVESGRVKAFITQHPLDTFQQGRQFPGQFLRPGSGHQAVSGAGKQFVLEGVAQFLQGLAERRLGHGQALCSPRHVALLQQDLQCYQQVQIGTDQLA